MIYSLAQRYPSLWSSPSTMFLGLTIGMMGMRPLTGGSATHPQLCNAMYPQKYSSRWLMRLFDRCVTQASFTPPPPFAKIVPFYVGPRSACSIRMWTESVTWELIEPLFFIVSLSCCGKNHKWEVGLASRSSTSCSTLGQWSSKSPNVGCIGVDMAKFAKQKRVGRLSWPQSTPQFTMSLGSGHLAQTATEVNVHEAGVVRMAMVYYGELGHRAGSAPYIPIKYRYDDLDYQE